MSREDLSSRQVGYATEKAYPGIRHTADLQAPRQWSLPSSLIVSTTSGILKDYPLLHSHREREERKRERRANNLFSSLCVRVIIEWTARHLPVKSTRRCPWKIMQRRRSPRMSALLELSLSCEEARLSGRARGALSLAVATRAFNSYHYAFQWFDKLCRCGGRVCVQFEFAEGEREREEGCGKRSMEHLFRSRRDDTLVRRTMP